MLNVKVNCLSKMKTCKKCEQTKALSNFPKNDRYADGYGNWCKECHREANRQWYAANKEKQNAKSIAWAKANPESAKKYQKKWKDANKNEQAKKHAKWQKNNLHRLRAIAARRKAAKLRATPLWANLAHIDAVYADAMRQQEETGQRKHVDHIVPLQSKHVCGLHVPANLQILDGAENESKKNYRWPDMP